MKVESIGKISSSDNKVIIVIPTYNERENLDLLIPRLFALDQRWRVLIVDDNSPDGTAQRLCELQKTYPNLFCLSRPRKSGYGSAYRDGFRFALENGFETIVQMDADLSHAPGIIPQMVAQMKDYDVVIGSRYVAGGGSAGWPVMRRGLSFLGNSFTRAMLGFSVKDVTSGFRCFKRKALEGIQVETTTSNGYAFQIETLDRICRSGFKVVEIPIVFQSRKRNESKMSFRICGEAFSKVLQWACRRIWTGR
ncbi:MAG TPA: polyprenol monophosphomannose synthase [Candidatus Bathyarchaeia archaeon]|nr:polyprenol monophosphomannose synthase [Candidatus Bathyarchaeia archaeon]